MHAIEFAAAGYQAGGKLILDRLSLAVRRGETLALLGPSGSGKTTALKLINALLMPTAGEVLVNGRSTATWDRIELRRSIGYAIQEIGLLPHYTVGENISLLPRLERWPRERMEARVRELLELVNLPYREFAGRYPDELSGGQRQRVGMARALALGPPILLLDEPFGALDPATRTALQVEFRRLVQMLQATAVFVTHDAQEALAVSDRIALLEAGRLRAVLTRSGFLGNADPAAEPYLNALRAAAALLKADG
ncbi:MAG: ATP-binding cassette domain-containing protein [Acidobacteria bacterium]|nr:ATP-binding cassette domain-containing protein [Acidobacteriota bacterium]